MIITSVEIKGAVAGVITSVFILVATFTAGGIYRNHIEKETEPGDKPLDAANLAGRGRSFFFQSCAHWHGQDADGGEDAPSLLKLQISGAHMALVIQSGIKDEMPSFAKKIQRAADCRHRGLPQDAALIGAPGESISQIVTFARAAL
jgi:mono/diheme cytochrome c family protein